MAFGVFSSQRENKKKISTRESITKKGIMRKTENHKRRSR